MRWGTKRSEARRAADQIAEGADRVENLFVDSSGSLPLLERVVPIPRDGIGKLGRISERQESDGRVAHAPISF